jgi:predicted component of type VI protein secretion system
MRPSFFEIAKAEDQYHAAVCRAGQFLHAPRVDGAAQVPVLYGREALEAAQATCNAAWTMFERVASPRRLAAYFRVKRALRRRSA